MRSAVSDGVQEVVISPTGIAGLLRRPPDARGIVLFAHGSGSGRFSVRNNHVADGLLRAGCASLLLDLLLPKEQDDRARVFDIALLAGRLEDAMRWVGSEADTAVLPIGLFGASTGAAAALVAAANWKGDVAAIVSRGGRPDLAGPALAQVRAPTLLIVGSLDTAVITLNEQAYAKLQCEKEMQIVPGATHLFEEPGTLDQVQGLAERWFSAHFR